MTLSIDYKILNPIIKDHIPAYASEGSAGLDLEHVFLILLILNLEKQNLSLPAYQFILKIQDMLHLYCPDQA